MRKLFLLPLALGLLLACRNAPSSAPASLATDPVVQIAQGEVLAKVRCGSCHAFPEPTLLPRATWQDYILPRMGYLLGIYPNDSTRLALLEAGEGGERVAAAGIFPAKPQISAEDWAAIQAYYLAKAPTEFPPYAIAPLNPGLELFAVKNPSYRLSPPSTTMVKVAQGGGLYLGDANTKAMYLFGPDLALQKAANVREGAVDLAELSDRLLITVMGSFSPTDAGKGMAFQLPLNPGLQPLVLMDSLQRPVAANWADLNGDQRLDAVISEFGKWTGRLAWWEQQPSGRFVPHVLRAQPGAIRTYLRDWNGDKKIDIVALFGQGDEGIFVYYNQGGGRFREERLLQFPSSWGSSSFTLYDFNGDGHDDILYTCGDNADYPPVLKPYHGIRIFTNNGKNQFKETYFFPLHGAYQAFPADFDGDGDIDIAALSFFPDFGTRPQESLVFLRQDAPQQFKAFALPGATAGRWIVMDAGDVDRDGDVDLVVGALTFEVVPDRGEVQRWVQGGLPFMVLENQLKH